MTTPLNSHLINLVHIPTVEIGVKITAQSQLKVY
jgi:hypothetical protein